MEKLYTVSVELTVGAQCGSDDELIVGKFRLKLKKVGKTTKSFRYAAAAAAAKLLQLCPTLCDPMDCSLPASSIHGIFQARVLEWTTTPLFLGFPGGSDSKESTRNVGDLGSIPGFGRSPGGGHGNPVQY